MKLTDTEPVNKPLLDEPEQHSPIDEEDYWDWDNKEETNGE